MKLPRLLVAAPGSSSGKTTLSLLLAAWARREGMDVRGFKAGPDFIDPQYLSAVTGRPVPSLDPWFLGKAALRRHFTRWAAGADWALVEGVMGLYDGKRGVPFGRYSSAEVALTLDLPVLIVLNARKAGPTLATQVLGLVRADPRVRFCGVALNFASGEKAVAPIAAAIKKWTGLPTFGWLPVLKELAVPERHLGLTAPSEMAQWQARLEAALPAAERSLDFKGIFKAAVRAPAWPHKQASPLKPALSTPFRLAVARDEVFHFYYPENLQLWRDLGAELLFFSPLRDAQLPEGSQGLLVGGGFPESFGAALAANGPLKTGVAEALRKGLPVWAECGGLMWLCEHLVDAAGDSHAMVGALPATVRMGAKLQNFGYTEAESAPGAWPGGGCRLKGHEFHHSSLEARRPLASAWTLRQSGKEGRAEGWKLKSGVATYFHAYLLSAPGAARAFAALCRGKPVKRNFHRAPAE